MFRKNNLLVAILFSFVVGHSENASANDLSTERMEKEHQQLLEISQQLFENKIAATDFPQKISLAESLGSKSLAIRLQYVQQGGSCSQHLPPEVWVNIFSYVTDENGFNDFSALSTMMRVHKSFMGLLMYHPVCFDYDRIDELRLKLTDHKADASINEFLCEIALKFPNIKRFYINELKLNAKYQVINLAIFKQLKNLSFVSNESEWIIPSQLDDLTAETGDIKLTVENSFPSLTNLSVRGSSPEFSLYQLAGSQLPCLTSLSLENIYELENQFFRNMTQLKTLNLAFCHEHECVADDLETISKAKLPLTSLRLSTPDEMELDKDPEATVSAFQLMLASLPQLTSLDLDDRIFADTMDRAAIFQAMKSFQYINDPLRSLAIKERNLTLEEFNYLPAMPNLLSLSLESEIEDEEVFTSCISSKFPALTTFMLNGEIIPLKDENGLPPAKRIKWM